MSFKDWAEITLSLATLATTVYFTRQLVRNDNNRARRDDEARLLVLFKNRLLPVAGEAGSIQRVGSELRRRYPDKKPLILAASCRDSVS